MVMEKHQYNLDYGSLRFLKKSGLTEKVFKLTNDCTIGGALEATIRLRINSPHVEDIHCAVELQGQAVVLKNRAAENPVKVNGEVVVESKILSNNDEIEVLGKRFRYEVSKIPIFNRICMTDQRVSKKLPNVPRRRSLRSNLFKTNTAALFNKKLVTKSNLVRRSSSVDDTNNFKNVSKRKVPNESLKLSSLSLSDNDVQPLEKSQAVNSNTSKTANESLKLNSINIIDSDSNMMGEALNIDSNTSDIEESVSSTPKNSLLRRSKRSNLGLNAEGSANLLLSDSVNDNSIKRRNIRKSHRISKTQGMPNIKHSYQINTVNDANEKERSVKEKKIDVSINYKGIENLFQTPKTKGDSNDVENVQYFLRTPKVIKDENNKHEDSPNLIGIKEVFETPVETNISSQTMQNSTKKPSQASNVSDKCEMKLTEEYEIKTEENGEETESKKNDHEDSSNLMEEEEIHISSHVTENNTKKSSQGSENLSSKHRNSLSLSDSDVEPLEKSQVVNSNYSKTVNDSFKPNSTNMIDNDSNMTRESLNINNSTSNIDKPVLSTSKNNLVRRSTRSNLGLNAKGSASLLLSDSLNDNSITRRNIIKSHRTSTAQDDSNGTPKIKHSYQINTANDADEKESSIKENKIDISINYKGIENLFQTPKTGGDSNDVKNIKHFLSTPKVTKDENNKHEDSSNLIGIKEVFEIQDETNISSQSIENSTKQPSQVSNVSDKCEMKLTKEYEVNIEENTVVTESKRNDHEDSSNLMEELFITQEEEINISSQITENNTKKSSQGSENLSSKHTKSILVESSGSFHDDTTNLKNISKRRVSNESLKLSSLSLSDNDVEPLEKSQVVNSNNSKTVNDSFKLNSTNMIDNDSNMTRESLNINNSTSNIDKPVLSISKNNLLRRSTRSNLGLNAEGSASLLLSDSFNDNSITRRNIRKSHRTSTAQDDSNGTPKIKHSYQINTANDADEKESSIKENKIDISINYKGIENLFQTPKTGGDSNDVKNVKHFLSAPKVTKDENNKREDGSNLIGIKEVFETQDEANNTDIIQVKSPHDPPVDKNNLKLNCSLQLQVHGINEKCEVGGSFIESELKDISTPMKSEISKRLNSDTHLEGIEELYVENSINKNTFETNKNPDESNILNSGCSEGFEENCGDNKNVYHTPKLTRSKNNHNKSSTWKKIHQKTEEEGSASLLQSDSTNDSSVKRRNIRKSHRTSKTHEDLNGTPNIKRSYQINKVNDADETQSAKENKNDVSVSYKGIENLFQTPKTERDSNDVKNLKYFLRTPKIYKDKNNTHEDSSNLTGVKNVFEIQDETNISSQTIENSTKQPFQVLNVSDKYEMKLNKEYEINIKDNTVRTESEKNDHEDSSNLIGIEDIFKTQAEEINISSQITENNTNKSSQGTQNPELLNNVSSTTLPEENGIFKTEESLNNDQSVKSLLAPPIPKSPKNDLTDVCGVKQMFATEEALLRVPSPNISGVEYLFNDTITLSNDKFDLLNNSKPLKKYKGKSTSIKEKTDNNSSFDDAIVNKAYTEKWLSDQLNFLNNPEIHSSTPVKHDGNAVLKFFANASDDKENNLQDTAGLNKKKKGLLTSKQLNKKTTNAPRTRRKNVKAEENSNENIVEVKQNMQVELFQNIQIPRMTRSQRNKNRLELVELNNSNQMTEKKKSNNSCKKKVNNNKMNTNKEIEETDTNKIQETKTIRKTRAKNKREKSPPIVSASKEKINSMSSSNYSNVNSSKNSNKNASEVKITNCVDQTTKNQLSKRTRKRKNDVFENASDDKENNVQDSTKETSGLNMKERGKTCKGKELNKKVTDSPRTRRKNVKFVDNLNEYVVEVKEIVQVELPENNQIHRMTRSQRNKNKLQLVEFNDSNQMTEKEKNVRKTRAKNKCEESSPIVSTFKEKMSGSNYSNVNSSKNSNKNASEVFKNDVKITNVVDETTQSPLSKRTRKRKNEQPEDRKVTPKKKERKTKETLRSNESPVTKEEESAEEILVVKTRAQRKLAQGTVNTDNNLVTNTKKSGRQLRKRKNEDDNCNTDGRSRSTRKMKT